MDINKVIPQVEVTEKITKFIIEPGSTMAQCEIERSDGTVYHKIVNFSSLWSGATTTQKNIIKGFFKNIASLIFEVPVESITGTEFGV